MKTDFLKSHIFISALISLVVLICFSDVLSADFVMWDDDICIYSNPNLGGLSLDRVYWAFTDVDSMMRYNPLTLLSWSATYHIFGLNPFGYHLINWLLHGLSSGVLFLIIRLLLMRPFRNDQNDTRKVHWKIDITASIATLFWALHPLRVEPVAWATDRTYCQAVFFLLLSTLCYIKAIDSEPNKKRYIIYFISAFALYAVSLLSFAIGTTYFAVLFVMDIYLFKRIGNDVGWWESQAVKKVILEKLVFTIPAVFISVISVIVRVRSAGVWEPPVSLSSFGIFDRLMQAVFITAYYIYRPFYPVNLAPVYTSLLSFDPLSLPFVASGIGLFVLSIGILIYRKRWPIGAALLLSHVILLIPVMGLFEHPHYHVDRYSLVSSLCLSIFIAYGILKAVHTKYWSIIVASAMVMVISILCVMSIHQIKVWNNSESLFSHIIETLGNHPHRQDIYWRLGKHLYLNGRPEKAIPEFVKALEIDDTNLRANQYMANIEYRNGNLERSAFHLQKLLINDSNNYALHYQLSLIFQKLKKVEEASYHYGRAMLLRPLPP